MAEVNTTLFIETEGFGDFRDIKINQNVRGMVSQEEVVVYHLTVPKYYHFDQSSLSLSIDLEPYVGNPDVYVHYDTIPDSLSKYQWSSREMIGMESLTMTHEQFTQVHATMKNFYIAVYGTMGSTYRLLAYFSDLSWRQLIFDCTETGYIEHDEIVSY